MTGHTPPHTATGQTHPFAAIIFDTDGTLIDSEVPGLDIIHQVTTDHGLVMTRHAARERFRGVPMANVASWFAEQLDRTDDAFIPLLQQHIRSRMAARFQEGLNPMPGAVQLLERLTVPYCVATNGPPERVSLTLSLSGLAAKVGEHVYSALRARWAEQVAAIADLYALDALLHTSPNGSVVHTPDLATN